MTDTAPDRTATRMASIEAIGDGLASVGYISTREIAMAIYLAYNLTKPILVEGPAGVGKTDLAQSIAGFLELPLVRLQCYEGLDESKALYEWKYGKQLLYTQILKEKLGDLLADTDGLQEALARLHGFNDVFFSEDFLEPRPLLKALKQDGGAVLLVDEIDKSTRSSRPSCSRCCRTTKSPCPSSAPCTPRSSRWSSSRPTRPGRWARR